MWKNRVKNKLKIKYLPYFAIGKSATARKAPAESFLETRTYTHIHTRVPSYLNQAENKNGGARLFPVSLRLFWPFYSRFFF